MARSSEAMGRWNGKAWKVNIWTRKVVRRDQRWCKREAGRIMIEAMEKILPKPHWVRGPEVSATRYFDKTNWEEAPAEPSSLAGRIK